MRRTIALATSMLCLAVTPFNCLKSKNIDIFPKCVTEQNRAIRELYQHNVNLSYKKPFTDSKIQHKKKKSATKKENNNKTLQKSGKKDKNRCENAADIITISYEDAQVMLKAAMAEGEGEGIDGKARIMKVIYNRMKSKRHPNTAKGVVFEKGQFSCVKDGRYKKAVPDYECHLALADLESGLYSDFDALFFENKKNSWQSRHRTFICKAGRHRFYK